MDENENDLGKNLDENENDLNKNLKTLGLEAAGSPGNVESNELEPFRPWGGGCCPPRAYGGVGDGVPHIMSQCDGMAPCSKSLHGGGCAHDLAYPCAPGSGWNPKPGRAVASSASN